MAASTELKGLPEGVVTSAGLGTRDTDLVERHRYGDAQAFALVYERFERMVFNIALRMAGDPEVAADLAQETFVRVYRHLGSFAGRSTLKTWIYRVTLNCCRSGLRKRKSHVLTAQTDNEEQLERVPDRRSTPEERAIYREMEAQLTQALAGVPLLFREAVVLRDVRGLTYEEIAEVLGVRLGTVRSRIARGRERLRRLLEAGQ